MEPARLSQQRDAPHRGHGPDLSRAKAGLAAILLGAALAGPEAARAQEADEIPAGPGRDEVLAWCSGCHSMATVTQQGMNRRRWDETITWMVEDQNMPAPAPAERDLLLDYLTEHFGESRGGGCRNTPWGRRCS